MGESSIFLLPIQRHPQAIGAGIVWLVDVDETDLHALCSLENMMSDPITSNDKLVLSATNSDTALSIDHNAASTLALKHAIL